MRINLCVMKLHRYIYVSSFTIDFPNSLIFHPTSGSSCPPTSTCSHQVVECIGNEVVEGKEMRYRHIYVGV